MTLLDMGVQVNQHFTELIVKCTKRTHFKIIRICLGGVGQAFAKHLVFDGRYCGLEQSFDAVVFADQIVRCTIKISSSHGHHAAGQDEAADIVEVTILWHVVIEDRLGDNFQYMSGIAGHGESPIASKAMRWARN